MKKRILIISIYYPPINSIASNRIASFGKYLNKNDYEVDILTLSLNNEFIHEYKKNINIYRVPNKVLFKSLKFEKKSNIFIHKLKALYNILLQNLFNEYGNWKKESVQKALQLHKSKKYDFVLSSYAPVDVHDVAIEIKKNDSNIIWVADMRDEMSLNMFLTSRRRKKLALKEKEIFKYCDSITSVSKPILADFRKLSNNSRNISFSEIRNGFDFKLSTNYKNNKKFTINYLGSFYGDIVPTNFLKALSNLIENKLIENIEVNFIGSSKKINFERNLKGIVNSYGKIEHKKSLERMKTSDCLLLIHPTNGRKGVFTGKLFEYLGILKPILALIDESDVAAELIRKTNSGFISDNSNISEIEKNILKIYNIWKQNKSLDYNIDLIQRHHRKEQVIRLEMLLDKLYCSKHSKGKE